MALVSRLSVVVLIALALSAGCASRKGGPAPVEDRGTSAGGIPASTGPAPVAPAPRQPPGFENAGKPGYYTVKPGDTLIRIGLENGQNWRDVARWNGIDNPNVIEVGQVLRVIPPEPAAAAAAAPGVAAGTAPAAAPPASGASAPGAAPGVVTRPVTVGSVTPAGTPPPAATAPSSQTGTQAAPAASQGSTDELDFLWPATGQVVATFDEVKNKGVGIAGKAGDAVLAAADGRVVYAGAGLRGYGNLIILKHNNTYLTAYAHNQTLLVKEDQTVRRGQRIAEMGSSDTDRVKLHFEIRRQGKPVDPAKYLPAR